MDKQIKSKQRVKDQGEVFTNEREVKAMCDLVSQECERIDSRFLEPACGDGNFLKEILERKLDVVKQKYAKSQPDYERNSFLACTSIYGVELLHDNAEVCRKRMYNIWNTRYTAIYKDKCDDNLRKAIEFVFSKNIVEGNALSLMRVDDCQKDTDKPIIFTEWAFVLGDKVKRREFRLDVLLQEHEDENSYDNIQLSIGLFDEPTDAKYWEKDPVTNVIIPKPTKEYSPVNYKEVFKHE